jgi:hypothetical protein
MDLEFEGPIWFWKGPAPHHFVTVPEGDSAVIGDIAAAVTYGWGCIPVSVEIGDTTFTTSLFPKDGGYIVPVKASVRRAERIGEGDVVSVRLAIDV